MHTFLNRLFSAKKKKLSPQQTLDNVLSFGHHLIHETEYGRRSSIFTLVKMLSDKIVSDSVFYMIGVKDGDPDELSGFFHLIEENKHLHGELYHEIYQIERQLCQDYNLEIQLGKDPVVTFPWARNRLEQCLKEIGTPMKPWAEDTLNHFATLYLPMGLTHIYNGNHSSYTGMVKGEGSIHIHPASSHTVCDVSPLYRLIQFDGVNFVKAGTNIPVGIPLSFAHGCIFELGRMIAEMNIDFAAYKKYALEEM